MRLLLIADGAARSELATSITFYRPTYVVLDCGPDAALDRLAAARPDLVVLEAGHHPDRFHTLQLIRRASAVPLVVRSAMPGERDLLRALELGADLVLPRTLTARALVAHLDALLRRMGALVGWTHDQVEVGGLRIDLARHRVTIDRRPISLTPREFALLHELAANAGHVVPREMLLQHVWGREYHAEAHYLSVYVARLRAKIEADRRHPRYVVTVRGVGYELPREAAVAVR